MRVTSLLVLFGNEKKPSKMEDDEWNEINFHAKVTIILCLSDEVLYNIINEESTASFWCRLESLYMMKSLSNKLFMKKLYSLWMKKGTPFNQQLNAFNRILSGLLALKIKQREEDKTLLLLSSLLLTYDHLAITTMYGKDTLELKDVRQMIQNIKLMKKIDSTKKASGLVVKGQRGSSQSRRPKRDSEASSSFTCYFLQNTRAYQEKLYEIQETLKKRVSILIGRVPVESQINSVEEADANPCDVLTAA